MDRNASWDSAKQQVIDDIALYGWHCAEVRWTRFSNAFCYTVGLRKSFDHPELAVFGLKPGVARLVLTRAVARIHGGELLQLEAGSDALLAGCPCIFEKVPEAHSAQCFDMARWYYQGIEVPYYQIVWPSLKAGFPRHGELFPADAEARFEQVAAAAA